MVTDQLLEEIEAGQGETLTRAARRIPRSRQDKPVTMSCLFRWVLTGVVGPNGQRVHLEAARLAGKWITTPGALRRFIEKQTPGANDAVPVLPKSPTARLRASRRAADELKQMGI